MIGDSTMSIKPEKELPENGWGMALTHYCKSTVQLDNYARNGRSTKSFINENLWDTVYRKISKGDYVIIQFGHNDEKANDTTRYTLPQTSYKINLRKFITDTREKGGIPILCTSIVRRDFDDNGKLKNTHGDYPNAVRELAVEMNTTLIDLEKLTTQRINELGPEQSKTLFMILAPKESPNFPNGKEDNTHLKIQGAEMVAELFVQEVKRQQLKLSSLFK